MNGVVMSMCLYREWLDITEIHPKDLSNNIRHCNAIRSVVEMAVLLFFFDDSNNLSPETGALHDITIQKSSFDIHLIDDHILGCGIGNEDSDGPLSCTGATILQNQLLPS
ncbi:hypothetical protein Tco_1467562 [Tanacetum coccineum]